MTTPDRTFDLEIEHTPAGFYLHSFDYCAGEWYDTWHQTLQSAFEQAAEEFGISPDVWKDVAK